MIGTFSWVRKEEERKCSERRKEETDGQQRKKSNVVKESETKIIEEFMAAVYIGKWWKEVHDGDKSWKLRVNALFPP